jgi:hypothetical protein
MKKLLVILGIIMAINSQAQLIPGTIKPGSACNTVDVYLKPDFSNTNQYIFQMGLPIAFAASTSPTPTIASVTLDPTFVTNFCGGNAAQYPIVVYNLANNTAGDVDYYVLSLTRGGTGASNPQTWTAGQEIKVLTVTFANSTGLTAVKIADFQDGGSDGQGNFYTADGNGNYYISAVSTENFYNGFNGATQVSTVGGSSSEGYAIISPFDNCAAGCAGAIGGTATGTNSF